MSPKIIGLIVLLIFLVIFAVQNTQPVAVKLFFWQISTSAVLTILVSYLVGFLTAWLLGVLKPGGKKD
ncbi:MAG: LapA family protein [Proteobacteria bacterium]|nr:LapA family protein [Pseudomonadota bacterium]